MVEDGVQQMARRDRIRITSDLAHIYNIPTSGPELDKLIRKTLANKRAIAEEIIMSGVGRLTALERNSLTAERDELRLKVASLQDEMTAAANTAAGRIQHLKTEVEDLKGALDGSTKLVESLRKELSAERSENVDLRENIQRTLGYIDRVNEDSPPATAAIVQPERVETQMRGPRLSPLGRLNYASDDFGGAQFGNTQSVMRRRY